MLNQNLYLLNIENFTCVVVGYFYRIMGPNALKCHILAKAGIVVPKGSWLIFLMENRDDQSVPGCDPPVF